MARTVAGTGTGTTTGGVGTRQRRGWGGMRRRRGAGGAIAQNKVFGGTATKFVDWRAASGRRMKVLGAKIGEKFVHMGADVKLGFYTVSHPIHPLRRVAAKEKATNVKQAATERKRQKIARASDVESRKRANVRENRARNLNQAM